MSGQQTHETSETPDSSPGYHQVTGHGAHVVPHASHSVILSSLKSHPRSLTMLAVRQFEGRSIKASKQTWRHNAECVNRLSYRDVSPG